MLRRLRLTPGSFLRNVLTVMTGTVIAQAIPMVISPLLTRLYIPADYGLYGTFMLAAYFVSALASGRYEFAIMMPDSDDDAKNVVALCFAICLVVAVAGTLVVVGLRLAGIGLLQERLGGWSYLLGPMMVLMSVYQTLSYWALRKQRFRLASASRVTRALLMGTTNVTFGLLAVKGGLIVSSLLGQAAATILLAVQLARGEQLWAPLRFEKMRAFAKEHRNFPLYSLPGDLLSTGSSQLPLFFLDTSSAGLFTFVQTVVNAPLSVVSGSVLDSFKERATRDLRTNGNFRSLFRKVALSLAGLGVVPMLALVLFGPAAFASVFGEPWRGAGDVARILSGMYFFKFVASPLSYTYFVVGKQKEDFLLHLYILGSTACILAVGPRWFGSSHHMLAIFGANYALFYVVYLVRSYQFSAGRHLATRAAK